MEQKPTFVENYKKHKEDIFAIATSTLIYFIMLPLIFAEHRRPEPRYVDFDMWFVHLKQMPMVLYILILTVSLATMVNFFRDILSVIKKYFETQVPGSQAASYVDKAINTYDKYIANQPAVQPIDTVDHNIVHQYPDMPTMQSEFGKGKK